MKPTIGRVVIYRQPLPEIEKPWNGTAEHPAIITRVWSDTCVNLHVFCDANPSIVRCSVVQLPELPADVKNVSGNSGWRWPDRFS